MFVVDGGPRLDASNLFFDCFKIQPCLGEVVPDLFELPNVDLLSLLVNLAAPFGQRLVNKILGRLEKLPGGFDFV